MIYIAAYIVLGISTGIWAWWSGKNGEEIGRGPTLVIGLVWPVVWATIIINAIRGRLIAKCAWCGKSVSTGQDIGAWRSHYLDECGRHPLALRLKQYEVLLDELDAKHTAQRVRAEKLESELKPYREMTETIQKRMRAEMDRAIMTGESNTKPKPTSKWEILHG